MPQYLCKQNTTLPNGCIAFSGERYEIPDSFAHKGSWESLEVKQDVLVEKNEECADSVQPTQDDSIENDDTHEEFANIVFNNDTDVNM